ncbi:MAG: endonuclease/exonuclease/phosphatase family protein [Bacteroidales bacterium]|nr:endonuclease/exonuclease/phosphatase family protein [Bacteroidales bacterium]
MPDSQRDALQVMFYNVENLFDTLDSSLDDDEFLPGSPRKWDSYKYYRKLNNIFKVIMLCSNDMEAPDLVGLCEVESPGVLGDLCEKTYLSREAYGYVISTGRDERGINTALLYRKEKLDLLSTESWCPVSADETLLNTRAFLYTRFKYDNDTIDVIVCHWPSRRGGTIPSEIRRKAVASYLRAKIDSIGNDRKIIIMGDLNDEPTSESVCEVLDAKLKINNKRSDYLVNTVLDGNSWPGTYKYQGTWYHFDQIIISGVLLESDSGLYYRRNSFRVINSGVLLTDDTSYRGLRPFSTWWGYDYTGGFSDHLPVTAGLCSR